MLNGKSEGSDMCVILYTLCNVTHGAIDPIRDFPDHATFREKSVTTG